MSLNPLGKTLGRGVHLREGTLPPRSTGGVRKMTTPTRTATNIVLEAAIKYVRWGWRVVPILARKKRPRQKEWQNLILNESELPEYFMTGDNVGVLLGKPSRGLVDLDLDCPEAMSLAPDFLPYTGRIHGRKSKPSSHWWYRATPVPTPRKFSDIDGTCLVELRSTGQQTAVPPSVHPSGELIVWRSNKPSARVDGEELRTAVSKLAAAALIARHWPEEGSRDEAALALAGILLRAGWDEKDAGEFIAAVARGAGDEEWEKRKSAARETQKRRHENREITGRPRLAELLGPKVVELACNWLGLVSAETPRTAEHKEAADRDAANANSDARPLTWETVPAFDPTFVPKTKWIVPDFIPERNIALVYGQRGTFKSDHFLWIAKPIAAGGRYVLVLDYENPQNVLKDRDADLELDLAHNPNLKIWDRFSDTPPPRPGDPRLGQLVKDSLKRTRKSPLLAFDSWASLLEPSQGGETTGQIAPIYNHFRRLCDLGATVVVFDHPRKYMHDVIYGGEDKEAKADVFHTFIYHENKASPLRPIIQVESYLKRYAPKGYSNFAFKPITKMDTEGKPHVIRFERCNSPQVEEQKRARIFMADLIKKNPNRGQEELVELAAGNLSQKTARETLKNGVPKFWTEKKMARGKLVYTLTA